MLFRQNSLDLLLTLKAELADRTLDQWFPNGSHERPRYTPWVCVPSTAEQPNPVFFESYSKGELLVAQDKLQTISSFLRTSGNILLADLAKHCSRQVDVFTSIASERPELIENFQRAKRLLENGDSNLAHHFNQLVDVIVPLNADSNRRIGISSDLARGAVFFWFPKGYSCEYMSIDFAHELGHQALMLLHSSDRLMTSDYYTPVYSGVRGVARPAIQSLHAAAALSTMLIHASAYAASNTALAILSKDFVAKLSDTLTALKTNCNFTPVGEALLEDMSFLARGAS